MKFESRLNHPLGGEHFIYTCDNGYGASVVKHKYSYGGDMGLWELAVIEAKTGKILYDTPITEDVIGFLTWENVQEIVKMIDALPKRLKFHFREPEA